VGKDGKQFTIYKFRTMRANADRDRDHKPAEKGDSRVTRVGRWLRLTRVDELPQLYNIFLGDMDVVGPRPFVPSQEADFVNQIPFYRHRWAVKPGATGWAQINRAYCSSLEDNIEKLSYDLFYIKNMSLGLDLIILVQTLKILVLGRGAQ
jgi:lipopolysaccharide/colanic/teichoic acid biosynthesis glycosyltransferase